MTITYAGHATVFLESEGSTLLIDPFLTHNPTTSDRLKNPTAVDVIAITHGHMDHTADLVRVQNATDATVFGMVEFEDILPGEGIPEDKFVGSNRGGSVDVKGWRIAMTAAVHSSSYHGKDGRVHYAGEACGLVVSRGGKTVFHAGDTDLFGDLALIGARYRPDIALLPIGGHYTMDGEAAAEAARLLGVKRAIPIHYRTFGLLAQSADAFIHACAQHGISVSELAPGDSLTI